MEERASFVFPDLVGPPRHIQGREKKEGRGVIPTISYYYSYVVSTIGVTKNLWALIN